MSATLEAHFEAVPFAPNPAVVSKLIRGMAAHENLFTDYERACSPLCENIAACPKCKGRLEAVSRSLTDPKARVWVVWRMDEKPDVVGVLYLTEIIPGGDAKAHYVFFDNDLVGKTQVIENMIAWCFEDHDGWKALGRMTVEIPVYAASLARHASKKLGFGGYFEWKEKGRSLKVEGVRRGVVPWRGKRWDMLIMGRLNNG